MSRKLFIISLILFVGLFSCVKVERDSEHFDAAMISYDSGFYYHSNGIIDEALPYYFETANLLEVLPEDMSHKDMNETYVDTMSLKKSTFNKQIVCNGKLKAKAVCELNFSGQGRIDNVFVKEGQMVEKGDVIATLDKQERERELGKAEHELERARIELTDKSHILKKQKIPLICISMLSIRPGESLARDPSRNQVNMVNTMLCQDFSNLMWINFSYVPQTT